MTEVKNNESAPKTDAPHAEGAAKRTSRPSRSDGRATRAKLLDAARRIIMEEGTDKLTIERVIGLAEVSKGSFLYHFPSRDRLLEALVNDYAAHLDEVQTRLEASVPDVPHPLLASYLRWYEDFHSGEIDRGASPLVALVMASQRNRRFLEPVRDWYRGYFDRLAETSAEDRKDAADFPDGAVCDRTDALLLTLAMDGLFFHRLFGTDVLTEEERRALLGRIALRSGNASKRTAD